MMRARILAFIFTTLAIASTIAADSHKAAFFAAPRLKKSAEASQRHLAGRGLFIMDVDTATGRVTAVHVQLSTGQKLLDQAARQGLRLWRAKPDTVQHVRVPVAFDRDSDFAHY